VLRIRDGLDRLQGNTRKGGVHSINPGSHQRFAARKALPLTKEPLARRVPRVRAGHMGIPGVVSTLKPKPANNPEKAPAAPVGQRERGQHPSR
jgi:hypothetical protein